MAGQAHIAEQRQDAVSKWAVTEEGVTEAVQRIIEAADPLLIVAFGSRARGAFRPDSDLDLAVMVETPEDTKRVGYQSLEGRSMPIDLLVYSKERHEKFRRSINSVHSYIDEEGVVLYARNANRSPNRTAIAQVSGRSRVPEVSAA